MFSRVTAFALLVFLPLRVLAQPGSPEAKRSHAFDGETMGSTFSVRIADAPLTDDELSALRRGVEDVLHALNAHMSTYDPTTDISRFNASTGTELFPVDPELVTVARRALEVAADSGGAFDPTVMPLVALWGFGPSGGTDRRPEPSEIAEQLAHVGFAGVTIGGPDALRKARPDAQLDLNAIAPGYAADRVATYLRAAGCSNVLVDIGGEIMAWGRAASNRNWRVAIEAPVMDAPAENAEYRELDLRDRAIATSGDYRRYFEADGQVYSHHIDPRNGYPISNGVTSVSVLAPDCMTADAYATAITVLGPDKGLAWIAGKPGIDALVIVRTPDGRYVESASAGFPR